MNGQQWIGPVATLAAALMAAGIAWFLGDRRSSAWKAVKSDYELAESLSDENPMKDWLIRYADVRLRFLAASEIRGSWWAPRKSFHILSATLFAAYTVWIWIRYRTDGLGEGVDIWMMIVSTSGAAAYSVTFLQRLVQKQYRIPGLKRKDRIALNSKVQALENELSTKHFQ